jgi:hypothetical protein
MSCALPGAAGTCSPVSEGGTDPTGTCSDMGAASCGATGVCDGRGACQVYAAGTICAAGSCPVGGATQTLARTCDGAGACRAASTLSCAPFTCNGTFCSTTCVSDGSCAAPNICDLATNLCGNQKPLGAACAGNGDCLTGNFCVDGVCCGSSTCGTCYACNVAGSAGTCTPVPAGAAEPHSLCAATVASTCGTSGVCNGAGQCAFHSLGTACGPPACKGKLNLAGPATCNGTGTCTPGVSSSCAPYACSGAACLVAPCADNNACAPGHSCTAGKCI